MKNFLARLRTNVWDAFKACLDATLACVDNETLLGKKDTTRRLVSLSFIVSTVAFWVSIPVFCVGLFNTIRGK